MGKKGKIEHNLMHQVKNCQEKNPTLFSFKNLFSFKSH